MENCIFCKIARHEIPAQIVYEDDELLAFKDLMPGAPVHLLIIPKRHIPGIMELIDDDAEIVGKIILTAKKLAEENYIDVKGFRIVANSGQNAGQSVAHLHFHLLGGKHLGPLG